MFGANSGGGGPPDGGGGMDFSSGSYARGGIVPSAARGWQVPSLGSGGMLAQVHSREMILPANISEFVQNAAANASGAGGGHTFNLGPIVAMDAPGVQRLFMTNGSALVAALNSAIRNGSLLRVPT